MAVAALPRAPAHHSREPLTPPPLRMPRNYVSKGVKEPMKTAQQMMREQMDELMGKSRDVPLEEREAHAPKFEDPDVDRYFLCGCSPYELLKGTKSETIPGLDRDGFLW